ncbi:hypothetical protein CLV97_1234 [Planifilum fimeticola]|uniref:Uncharacterized protein n=1 Tax=Planifilum fimeticola TaxID=201975 RepID=A0A2T0LC65_9BACL|nr:hypothetical protein [Planifilum fimeticola]PRX39551.1 hypothetical protein CLV97_1234 [Planifilum fimeticola]
MARKRMIDPNFWTDEKLGTCAPLARYTFMGLISQADDAGRLNGHPALIKSQVFPYDYDITPDHVTAWLNQLEQKGLIRRYEVDGQSYICIPKFLKHQKINRPSESKLPAPPDTFNEGSVSTHESLTEPSPRIEKKTTEEKRTTTEQIEDDVDNDSNQADRALKKIERHFVMRRGVGTVLSVEDMESMQVLLKDGFTVDEILAGIDHAFESFKPKHKRDRINSFKYCESVIRSLKAKKQDSHNRVGYDLPKAQREADKHGDNWDTTVDPAVQLEILEELNQMRKRFKEKQAGGQ